VVRFGGAITASRKMNVPIGHVLAYVAGNLTVSLLTFFSMRRFYPGKLHFDRALAKRLILIAWPAGVLEFVVMAYSRGSYFFLHSQGPTAQGEYAAADRLVRPVLSIAGALFMSSLPTVATLAVSRDFETLRRMYKKAMLRIFQGLVPLMFASWLLAGYLLGKAAPEYAGATAPFRILSVGAVFMFVNQLSTTFVVALGRFRTIMIVALINLVVYLGLAAFLVPRFGATGAATATSVMEAINTVIQVVIVLNLLRSDGRPPQDDGARAPGLA
jgi:O-antigen/teichoic acid export membrane protein